MITLSFVIAALLVFLAWREKAWSAERADLLQRVQAPEIAVREHVTRPERAPVMPIPIDDDKAYAAARERRESVNGHAD
jgi:hypothetical protein